MMGNLRKLDPTTERAILREIERGGGSAIRAILDRHDRPAPRPTRQPRQPDPDPDPPARVVGRIGPAGRMAIQRPMCPPVTRYSPADGSPAAIRAVLSRAAVIEAAGLPAADAIDVAGREATGHPGSVPAVAALAHLERHGTLTLEAG